MNERETLLAILERARWAPSGDNTQPWRFEIVADDHLAIHGFDTRDHVIYDFDGHPSHMAHGALLETLRIAATAHCLEASWSVRPGCPETAPVYDVRLRRVTGMTPDPLLPFIEARTVQRRPMRTTPLTTAQKQALAAAAGAGYRLRFFESWGERRQFAKLLWDNADIRLRCPEAYEVHREIIEWGTRYSKDRIPEHAVGVDPLTGKLMRWVMQSWPRVEFFNRYLLGTIAPRLQLDYVPALACAAHLLLYCERPPASIGDYVDAGGAMQRVWLTATANGLHLQPEMTPLIFAWYARANRPLSGLAAINRRMRSVADGLQALLGGDGAEGGVFLARIGRAKPPAARSLRRDLADLMVAPGPDSKA